MPRRYVARDSASASVAKALDHNALEPPGFAYGAMPRPYRWRLKYAANCSSPVYIQRDGVSLTKGPNQHVFGTRPLEIPVMTEIEAPCRRCENCLARRAAHWRMRGYSECRASERTWFGTLTLSPEQHSNVGNACRSVASKNGDDFDLFSHERQFALRHRCISREITLYLKRLRKQSGAQFKFMCVAEEHKTGLPHYHMLVHECDPAKPIRHKVLSEQWRVGFSQWKLVEGTRSAGYVTKYLAKSSLARVRASLDYGNTSSDIAKRENPALQASSLPLERECLELSLQNGVASHVER